MTQPPTRALSRPRVALLTTLAMAAFAANSLLCRAALRHTAMDPASFTTLRLLAGAASTWALVRWLRGGRAGDRADGKAKGQAVCQAEGNPSGQAAYQAEGNPSGHAVCQAKGNPSGQAAYQAEDNPSGHAVCQAKGNPSGQAAYQAEGNPSGQAVYQAEGNPSGQALAGSWVSGLALFVYAAAFSFAYLTLPAGMGALLLFGAVQATMVLCGWWRGERLGAAQGAGLVLALAGLLWLLAPGRTAPPLGGALLMLAAGVAWGVYSLRARGAGDPGRATAGNFLRAVPMALALSLALLPWARLDRAGVVCALLAGGLASGLGYALWYAALGGLRAASAAAVQLSVPVLAALAGVGLLGEPVTVRLLVASAAVLGGIALVLREP